MIDLTLDSDDYNDDKDTAGDDDKHAMSTLIHSRTRRQPLYSIIVWVITRSTKHPGQNLGNRTTWSPKSPILVPHRMDVSPKYPDFYIIGIVDGLSEQLDTGHDCASHWTAETVVRHSVDG